MKAYLPSTVLRSPYRLTMLLFCTAVIVSSAVSFAYNGVVRAVDLSRAPLTQSVDFYQFYAIGQLWSEGEDVYDYALYRRRLGELAGPRAESFQSGNYYPPQAAALLSLLPLAPTEAARVAFIAFNVALALAVVALIGVILAGYRSLTLLDLTFLACLLNTGFARRTVREGQLGLLVFVLLLVMFLLLRQRRQLPAAIALAATSIKPTFSIVYLGTALAQRRYRFLALCALALLLFTVTPLALTGRPVVETLTAWPASLRTVAEDVNDPSPFLPYSALMIHLAPLVYRVLDAYNGTTVVIGGLIVLALCAYSAHLIWRTPRDAGDQLLDFGLASTLSLLSVYHRQYDVFLLLPGMLYIYLHATRVRARSGQTFWAAFLIAVLVLTSLPGDLFPARLPAYLPPEILDTYVMRVLAPFPTWAAVGVLGSLIYLKREEVRRLRTSANDTSRDTA